MPDLEWEALLEKIFPSGRLSAPAYWDNPAYNQDLQPVVGVCWYEANAYCAWLTAQTGKSYRLPSEAEWELAARGGSEERIFAWGRDFDPVRCNSLEAHLRGTSPIGVFPGGDTTEGLTDMTGNVVEWCCSIYRRDSNRAGERAAGDGASDLRALRGGSWRDHHDYCTCAFSRGRDAGERYSGIGFRVCCVGDTLTD